HASELERFHRRKSRRFESLGAHHQRAYVSRLPLQFANNCWIINPAAAPPRTSQAELILEAKTSTHEISAKRAVIQSITAARPSCQLTPAIRPSAPTLTPWRNPLVQRDRRSIPTTGNTIATKINDGR